MKVRRVTSEQKEEQQKRIRPQVYKKLLLDEKSRLMRRVQEIDRRLQTA